MGCGCGEASRPARTVSSTVLVALVASSDGTNHHCCRELKARDDRMIGYAGAEEPLVLLPLEVMIRPLELLFRYHFDGDKPTNRLDKVSSLFNGWVQLCETDDCSPNTSSRTSSAY